MPATAKSDTFLAPLSEVDPEVEGSLDYALGRHSSIGWTARYGVEQPTEQNSAGQVTFRTGVQFRYAFTARISSAVGPSPCRIADAGTSEAPAAETRPAWGRRRRNSADRARAPRSGASGAS